MSQPTYSNNKEDVLKNLKKILGVCSGSKGEEMERVVSLICLENQNAKKPDSIRISGVLAKI
jgi:hypothetical protein